MRSSLPVVWSPANPLSRYQVEDTDVDNDEESVMMAKMVVSKIY